MYGKEYQLPLKFNAWVEQDDSNTVMYSLEQERGEYLICAGTWRAIVTPPWWKQSSHITVNKRYSPVFLLMVLATLMAGGEKMPETYSPNVSISIPRQTQPLPQSNDLFKVELRKGAVEKAVVMWQWDDCREMNCIRLPDYIGTLFCSLAYVFDAYARNLFNPVI